MNRGSEFSAARTGGSADGAVEHSNIVPNPAVFLAAARISRRKSALPQLSEDDRDNAARKARDSPKRGKEQPSTAAERGTVSAPAFRCAPGLSTIRRTGPFLRCFPV